MGKKITSSSPLDTIAFDAIPSTWQYSNAITKHSYTPSSTSYGGGASGGSPYTSTNTNTDLTGDEKPCPPGKHMGETGTCVKNEKTSRETRLKKGIAEDEALGKTASAARKRKRLAGYQTAQKKRTSQIESGDTGWQRFKKNIGTAFKKGYDADGDGKIDPKTETKSRHDLKVEGAATIKKEEEKAAHQIKVDKCESTQGKKWENGACVDLAKFNWNPSTSSQKVGPFGRTAGSYFKKTELLENPGSPGCPKGQHREGFTCVDD